MPYKKGGNVDFFVWVYLFDPFRKQVDTTLKKQGEAGVTSEKVPRDFKGKLQATLLEHRFSSRWALTLVAMCPAGIGSSSLMRRSIPNWG